ncbi:MAG: c-type cytochrome [Hyphomicrobiales bacterium]|nr:c-type cytochrome [Hyphomicrobiales bacterium]
MKAAIAIAALGFASGAFAGQNAMLGLPPAPTPPAPAAVVALGEKLFSDRRLSFNGTMSCAMCHVATQGLTSNEVATSVGMEGKSLRRNAPTLWNVAYEKTLFRDGRETTLETQVWSPILSPDEMAAPSVGWTLARIASLPEYPALFARAFAGQGVSMNSVGAAIAAYERTLLKANSRFDRWKFGGQDTLSAQERAGYALFVGKGGCAQCHTIGETSALFSDGAFHDTGIGYRRAGGGPAEIEIRLADGQATRRTRAQLQSITGAPANDLGRFEVTQNPADRWAYKTPSLRNVALTAPYMHDGSLGALEQVVDYYDAGGFESPNKSPFIRPLGLTAAQKAALVAFLKTLTGE